MYGQVILGWNPTSSLEEEGCSELSPQKDRTATSAAVYISPSKCSKHKQRAPLATSRPSHNFQPLSPLPSAQYVVEWSEDERRDREGSEGRTGQVLWVDG